MARSKTRLTRGRRPKNSGNSGSAHELIVRILVIALAIIAALRIFADEALALITNIMGKIAGFSGS
jgi:hypothetical protein